MLKPYSSIHKMLVLWLMAIAILLPIIAAAHPLGNFTVSHYARLEVGAAQVRVRYIVDMAELSTFQELTVIDTDGDRSPSPAEMNAYVERIARQYAGGLLLSVDGQRIPLTIEKRNISIPSGDGGLPNLRVECDFVGIFLQQGAPQGSWQGNGSSATAHRLRLEDANSRERSGWREMVVVPQAGVAVYDSTAFGNGVTDELKAYPKDMLTAPLDEKTTELSFVQGQLPAGAKMLLTRDGRPVAPKSRDRLAELIAVPQLTFTTALLGLLMAVILGGLHALSPGHGKTVVGAYLVGSRGTARHAAFLGLTVTITHTLGVFALGCITLLGERFILPERLFPVLSFASGAIVLTIGLNQIYRRLRAALSGGQHRHHGHDHSHDDHHHDHSHDHHDHSHDHSHAHDHGPHGHSHLPPERITWRSLLALGISGGLLPCPSALVVLLAAISLHRVGYGLLLVLTFSLGLAGALTGVGLLFIYARRFVDRPLLNRSGVLVRMLPVFSALVITCAGAVICHEALSQSGVSWSAMAAGLK